MFIRRAFFLFCIPLILMGFASAHAQATDERLAQFEQIIQDEMAYYNIPGTAVAIIEGDEVIYAQGFGYRNVEDQLPFTTETRFRVGSTTKSMTSLLIAQLVDDGLLAWDTPVTDILPDFALSDSELTAQITVADLMGMATGLVSNTFDAFDWWEWEIDSLLDAVATQTINGEFRASHNYNNEVYALAGYVGAVASGLEPTLTSYQSLMQTRLFDPIGMASAIIADDHSQLGDNYAEPYEPDVLSAAGTVSRMIDAPIALVAPAGGVWVNIEDMAKYVITQMNGGVTPDGARIVSAGESRGHVGARRIARFGRCARLRRCTLWNGLAAQHVPRHPHAPA
ncbi:MAG: beta-lactamase family protein [Chloroflexi bacterium]|uniref:serine hydrolase domain-containing protein n=1 Tax=Candidatus Flexifilum breve TaxID=3140694 RepID=UPI0031348C24|nr:beta-lactamase family protein [Chloroflexota bacterium]